MNRPDLAPGETAVAMGPPVLGGGPSRGNDIGHPADVPKAASQSGSHHAIQTHDPPLAQSVWTGSYRVYQPDSPVDWTAGESPHPV